MQRLWMAVLVFLWIGDGGAASPAVPATTVTVGGAFDYRVRPGDTLTTIAARFGVAVDDLIESNRLSEPDRLTVRFGTCRSQSSGRWRPRATRS